MLKPCQGRRAWDARQRCTAGASKDEHGRNEAQPRAWAWAHNQAPKKKPGTQARLAPRQGGVAQPRTCLSRVSASLTAKPPPFSSLSCVTTPSLTSIE